MKKCTIPLVIPILAFSIQSASAQNLSDFLAGTDETEELQDRYDISLRDAPGSTIVYTRDDIDRFGATTLAEILDRTVGIHNSRSSTGNTSRRVVRGVDDSWLILYNGLVRDVVLSDTLRILLHDVERIEIIKGSHSSVYGQDAVAGTINLVTYSNRLEETRAGILGGSFGTLDAWYQRSWKNDDTSLSFSAGHRRTEGTDTVISPDRQSQIDTQTGTALSLAPAEGSFDTQVTEARFELGLGNTFAWRNHLQVRENGLGVGTAQVLDPNGTEQFTRISSDIEINREYAIGDFSLRAGYTLNRATFDDLTVFPAGSFFGQFPDGVQQTTEQDTTLLQVAGYYTRRTKKNTFAAILAFEREESTNGIDTRNYTIDSVTTLPTPLGNLQDLRDTDPLFDELTENTASLTLRNKWLATRSVKVNTGFRFDNSSLYGGVFNPRIGIEWIYAQNADLSLLYGESARTPSALQISSNGLFVGLGNPDLEVSKIRTLELVHKYKSADIGQQTINLFAYDQSDTISLVASDLSPNGLRFENIDDNQQGYGIDYQLDVQINPSFDLTLGLGFQQTNNEDLNSPRAPELLPQAAVDLRLIRGWNLNLSYKGVIGRERDVSDTRTAIDDYHLVDLLLKKSRIFGNVDLVVKASNIFDSDAREDISTAIADDVPIEPRVVQIGLSASF